MPWLPSDAERHSAKADTPARRRLWAAVANRVLRTGEKNKVDEPEAHAIRAANWAVERAHKG